MKYIRAGLGESAVKKTKAEANPPAETSTNPGSSTKSVTFTVEKLQLSDHIGDSEVKPISPDAVVLEQPATHAVASDANISEVASHASAAILEMMGALKKRLERMNALEKKLDLIVSRITAGPDIVEQS